MRGFTQGDLGNKVGISFQQMRKYETEKSVVSINKLCVIAKALSVELNVLLPNFPLNNVEQDSDYLEYEGDEECEIEKDMLNLMRRHKKIKSKEHRKAICSLTKSLSPSDTEE